MNTIDERGAGSLIRRAAAVTAAVAVVLGLSVPAFAAGHPAAPTSPVQPARVVDGGSPTSAGQPYAQLSRGVAAQGRGVRYAVAEHVCDRPTRGQLSCDAIKLVASTKGAHGAKAYVSPAYSTGPKGGFTPADLASAYGFNPAAAVNQTVAIVDAFDDPRALSDLNAFDAHYGLPLETATSFRKVNQNGAAAPLPAANAGWAGEIALDIEAVRAVCAHCKILLVEASSATGVALATAVNTAARLGATEISNSYGGPETGSDNTAAVAAAYNHPGIVITASTGDHGWYDWDFANEGSSGASNDVPNTPASYPTVVSVGGTALALNSDGSRQQEDVWNENGADDRNGLDPWFGWSGAQGASGGGCSTLYTAPSFQAQVGGYANTGCGTKRLAGDVAALADPYTGFDVYDSYGAGGWVTTGGTSLASPLVAAMWALAGGARGVRYPAQSLYDNLRFRPGTIHDVTLGGNAFCAGDSAANCSAALQAETTPPTGNPNNLINGNSFYANGWAGLLDCGYNYDGSAGTIAANTQCNATSGYDGPSGVGSPSGLALFTPTHPTVAIARPSVLRLRTAQTWSAVNFADPAPGGVPASYAWNWGDGTTSTTSSASVTHVFTAAGAHKVTVTVTDNYGQTGAAALTIIVGVPPTAVISGPTTVRVGTIVKWSAARSVERNTGGRIVAWTWKVGTARVGISSTWSHRFTTLGRRTLTLYVGDNTGLRGVRSISVNVVR